MELTSNEIFNYDFVIAPNTIHDQLFDLKKDHIFSKTKIIDPRYVFNNLLFKVSAQAIYVALEHTKNNLSLANGVLNNIHLQEFKSISIRSNLVKSVYESLKTNRLLITNPLNEYIFKGKRVLFINVSKNDKRLVDLLTNSGAFVDEFTHSNINANLQVKEYQNSELEMYGLFNEIFGLLKSGVKQEDIYILDPGGDYKFAIEDAQIKFDFKINFNKKYPLNTYPLVQEFFNRLANNEEKDALFAEYSSDYPDKKEVFELLSIIKQYPKSQLNKQTYLSLLLDVVSKKQIREEVYDSKINIVSEIAHCLEGKHIFIPNFSNNIYPKVTSDDDFFLDKEKESLNLLTSNAQNQINLNNCINIINSRNTVLLSRPLTIKGKDVFSSSLVKQQGIKSVVFKAPSIFYNKNYMQMYYTLFSDNYRNYNDEKLFVDSLKDLDKSLNRYLMYDNEFSGVEFNDFTSELKLSYSQINSYFTSPFVYYLDYILKLRPTIDPYYINFGKFVHKIMELSINKDFDFENEFNKHINEYEFSQKQKIFININKRIVYYACVFDQNLRNDLTDARLYSEKSVTYKIDKNTTLQGFIDKVYVNNDRIFLIDYKTGDASFSYKFIKDGQSLQLPIYALFARETVEFSGSKVAGLYLQPIKQKEIFFYNEDEKEQELIDYEKKLKFVGPTRKNKEDVLCIDPRIENTSNYVRGLKFVKSGDFGKSEMLLSDEEFDEMVTITEEKVKEAVYKIRKNDFKVIYRKLKGDEKAIDTKLPYEDIAYYNRDKGQVESLTDEEESEDGESYE